MRTRAIFVVAILVVIGAVILFGYNSGPDEETLSTTELRGLENDPEVQLESETETDETLSPEVADADPEVEVPVAEGEGQTDPDAPDVLTVEGYDPQRVRFLLQESDMPVELRNEYITRLDTADDDDEELAAILRQLRDDLNAG